ncbi:hypothetical protein TNCV_2077241 [Trichonephila clavipes]|nr:hypothetical protein TNCV_2077241 [Trichonephila clavipes]
MLNDDEIVTSVQEEYDPADDETEAKPDLHPNLRLGGLGGHGELENARKECHGQQRALHSSAFLSEIGYSTEKTTSARPNHTLSRQRQAPCCTSQQSRIPRDRMGSSYISAVFYGPFTDGLSSFLLPAEPMSNRMRGITFDNKENLKNWLNHNFDSRSGDIWRNAIDKYVERGEEDVNSNGEFIIE